MLALFHVIPAVYGDGLDLGVSSFTAGDLTGSLLWSFSLWFCSPLQLLLLFLGAIETERPSDWLLNKLGRAAGLRWGTASLADITGSQVHGWMLIAAGLPMLAPVHPVNACPLHDGHAVCDANSSLPAFNCLSLLSSSQPASAVQGR